MIKMSEQRSTAQSAGKVLEVLNVLLGNFAHGLTPGELAKATSLSPSNITRYIATLEEKGFAERVAETGRIRPSVRLAQQAVVILRSLDSARQRVDEIVHRVCTPQ